MQKHASKLISCKSYEYISKRDNKQYSSNKGFIEINGNLFSLKVSKAEKEGVEYWIKITDLGRVDAHKSPFGGRRGN